MTDVRSKPVNLFSLVIRTLIICLCFQAVDLLFRLNLFSLLSPRQSSWYESCLFPDPEANPSLGQSNLYLSLVR